MANLAFYLGKEDRIPHSGEEFKRDFGSDRREFELNNLGKFIEMSGDCLLIDA